MDWGKVRYFKKREFADNIDYANPDLLYSLDSLRGVLDERIYPSPVSGSLCRFGGSKTSQHYVGEDVQHITRLSTGVDVFIEGIPTKSLITILSTGLFGGIGIYLDTVGGNGYPWVMFHLDTRELHVPLVWFGVKDGVTTKYLYENHKDYWKQFKDPKMFRKHHW